MNDGQAVVKAREPLAVQAARVSWIIPLVVAGLNFMYSGANKEPGSFADWGARGGQLVVSGFSFLALVAGVVCAVGALIGLRGREAGGRKGEAVVGLAINGMGLAVVMVAVLVITVVRGLGHRAVDHSLTPAGYVAKGMPTAELPWQGEDYARAVGALKASEAEDVNSLPRWKSARSGAVFARMTDVGNFVDAGGTAADQLQRSAGISQPLSQVIGVYTDAERHGAVYDDELVEVGGFGLKLMKRVLGDMDTFVASLPEGDARRERMAAARPQVVGGAVDVVEGTIDVLGDKRIIGKACQVRLAGYARDTFPEILKRVPGSERASALARVERLRDEASGSSRVALSDLVSAMEGVR
jgi:hypothetical protein